MKTEEKKKEKKKRGMKTNLSFNYNIIDIITKIFKVGCKEEKTNSKEKDFESIIKL